jgi:hypothetical protein
MPVDPVGVYEHAGGQARQHVEHDVVEVAAHLGDVAGVDEQDVAFLQRVERLERHVL